MIVGSSKKLQKYMNFSRFILVNSYYSSSNVLFLLSLYLRLQPKLNKSFIDFTSISSGVSSFLGSSFGPYGTGSSIRDFNKERALKLFEIPLLTGVGSISSSSFGYPPSSLDSITSLLSSDSSGTISGASSCSFSSS